MRDKTKRIAILGAGITGLSLGWYLLQNSRQPIELSIYEKEERTGGWVHTLHQDGFLFEKGPRSFIARGNWLDTIQLIKELKLEKEVVLASPYAQQRYLFVDKKLSKLPANGFEFLQSFWLWPAIPGLLKDLFSSGNSEDKEESIDQFARRKFNDFIAEYLFDPMVAGIYAGDPKQISLKSAFPSLYSVEKTHGSLIRGFLKSGSEKLPDDEFIKKIHQSRVFSFRNGMETLTLSLAKKLESHVQTSCLVNGIRIKDGLISIHHEGGISFADHLYCTLPIMYTKELLRPHSNILAEEAPNIPLKTIAVVNLGFEEDFGLAGFGHLVPSKENERILGIVWDSSIFPMQNKHSNETRLTVMIGDRIGNSLDNTSQDQLVNIALEGIWKQLGISKLPKSISVKIAKNAIPQYHIGHENKINAFKVYLQKHLPQITLLGSNVNGVSVSDCIAAAKKTADDFAQMPAGVLQGS